MEQLPLMNLAKFEYVRVAFRFNRLGGEFCRKFRNTSIRGQVKFMIFLLAFPLTAGLESLQVRQRS
jgi:hypothetical protein